VPKRGIILKQHLVAEKANELTDVDAFLPSVFLRGRIFSADALPTQGEN
jgi:hypothetical protein